MSVAETFPARAPERDLTAAVGWIDARVLDAAGRRLGRVGAVFADREGRPWWLVVQRRGRKVIVPVDAVVEASGRRLLLDRGGEQLPAAGSDPLTDDAHEALMRRFGLDRRRGDRPARRRTREACAPERRRTRRRPGA